MLLSSQVPRHRHSLTMPVVTCYSMNMLQHEYLSWGIKKERICGKILAATSVRQATDIRAMGYENIWFTALPLGLNHYELHITKQSVESPPAVIFLSSHQLQK